MEENNIKEVYKPNREQRRKMAREQRIVDKKKHKDVNVSDTKVNNKIAGLTDAIKDKAISVKNDTGMDKMYFCFNADNIMDRKERYGLSEDEVRKLKEEVSSMVWRALAYSQELHEQLGAPLAPGAVEE